MGSTIWGPPRLMIPVRHNIWVGFAQCWLVIGLLTGWIYLYDLYPLFIYLYCMEVQKSVHSALFSCFFPPTYLGHRMSVLQG